MKQMMKVVAKIEKIEKLLTELKDDLKAFSDQSESKSANRKTAKALYSAEELRQEYEKLYRDFVNENSRVVHGFVESKDKNYLAEFCQANDIPIESAKASKAKLADEIVQWFVQRRAITKKV